ncbi:MAG TPA: ABC transporter permease [Candidatus Dormibacteraeota bacterium]|nr:ABC transporter permease [Candidatus Dormibacteraeota bacterium]
MSRLAVAFWNPIVAKEYRSRMRTWRSPLAMMIYILLIGGLGFAIFSSMAGANNGLGGQSANYGQTLFLYLVVFQMILLTFITPGLTAGAISSERERQTIDLLFVTRIPPFSIIWGKLLASMSFVVLLLVLSVPIFSLVFMFGGIELDQVLYAFLITVVAALTLGLVAIAFSTLLRRSLAATVAAYVGAFVLLFGTFGYGLIFPTEIDPNATKAATAPALTYLSPIIPLFQIAGSGLFQGYGVRYPNNGYLQQGGTVCQGTPNGGTTCYSTSGGPGAPPVIGKSGFGPIAPPQASGNTIPSGLFEGWQYWQATVVMQLAICLIALLASALWLPPVRRLPWRRRRTGAATVDE